MSIPPNRAAMLTPVAADTSGEGLFSLLEQFDRPSLPAAGLSGRSIAVRSPHHDHASFVQAQRISSPQIPKLKTIAAAAMIGDSNRPRTDTARRAGDRNSERVVK